ncbi:MAG: hypothetical protein NDI84_07105, partial [Steroidobacteraceae bacterium]|nr:hypothetical protein [Steroidobacteraceae bacterium]
MHRMPPMMEPSAEEPLVSRRGFLQAAGFALAAVGSGCTRGEPQLIYSAAESENLVFDGERSEFATTCAGCGAGCGVLAQMRAGRPIKLEGMPDHPISRGGLCAVGQASILGAFDRQRLVWPVVDEQPVGWHQFDTAVREAVAAANRAGRSVRLLLGTQEASSPTTMAAVRRFLSTSVDGGYCVFDALDASALSEAFDDLLDNGCVPRFRLDRADIVVAFDADFLGTWISPVEHATAYTAKRPSLHVQIESRLSVTGSKADQRFVVHPSELSGSLKQLLQHLLALSAGAAPSAGALSYPHAPRMSGLARQLWSRRGRALVICGSAETVDQLVCRQINHVLEAYGRTIDLNSASRQRLGSRTMQRKLLDELRARSVGVLLIAGVNPLHAAPEAEQWRDLLRSVPTIIAASERLDETTRAASLRCPVPDALASWGDLEPVEGLYCLRQPLLQAGPGQRPLPSLLAAWHGDSREGYELVREHWLSEVHQPELDGPFDAFWDRA